MVVLCPRHKTEEDIKFEVAAPNLWTFPLDTGVFLRFVSLWVCWSNKCVKANSLSILYLEMFTSISTGLQASGALQHIIACDCHLLISGIMLHHWQDCVSHHMCAWDKQSRYPLPEKQLHVAIRGLKLHKEALVTHKTVQTHLKSSSRYWIYLLIYFHFYQSLNC